MKVFLTGATGFVVGELLVGLSKDLRIKKIFCLVRAKDETEALQRLEKVFALHGDKLDKKRIVPVVGDLTDELLSTKLLSNKNLSTVDCVVHGAGDTHFMASKNIEAVNIGGTKSIIDWAVKLPNLETFAYIGTATICGKEINHRMVSEDESPNPNVEHIVKYTRTKMFAEIEVRKAIPRDKLLIIRPTSVMGDSRNVRPRDFAILWALKAINELRLVPAYGDAQIDVLGVDYVAKAIGLLLFAKRRYTTYHISSSKASATSLRKMADVLKRLDESKPDFCFAGPEKMKDLKKWSRMLSKGEDFSCNGDGKYMKYWKKTLNANGNIRILLGCLGDYLRFADQDIVFDNSRLIGDTRIELPVPAHEYLSRMYPYMCELDVMRWAIDS